MNYGIFQTVGKDTIPRPMWEPGTNPFRCFFFFWSIAVSSYACTDQTLCRSLSLPSQKLFSLAICPINSSHLGPPRFSVLCPQIRKLHWVPCVFFQLEPVWNTLNARYSPGNHRAHLICFLSFRDCSPSVPDAQCLENYCFRYFVCF